jgi:hypothetical protein
MEDTEAGREIVFSHLGSEKFRTEIALGYSPQRTWRSFFLATLALGISLRLR